MEELYKFKITEIKFKNGTTIVPKKINVFVGPNNAGKSRTLKELRNYFALQAYEKGKGDDNKIIDYLNYQIPKSSESFINGYNINKKIFETPNGKFIKNFSFDINYYYNRSYSENNIRIYNTWITDIDNIIKSNISFSNPSIHMQYEPSMDNYRVLLCDSYELKDVLCTKNNTTFLDTYGKLFVMYLGTEEKLLLCKSQENFGIQSDNINFLSSFKSRQSIFKQISNKTKQLFDKEVFLDNTTLGQEICIRVGRDLDYARNATRDDESCDIKLLQENKIEAEGDGIKNFVTTFLALNTIDKNVIIIDEPEAFLHPPIAREMGRLIASSAAEDKQIFISTHSEDLLKGIISETKDVNIIRITRDNDENDISIIDTSIIKKIEKYPMLIASNIFKGIFSKKVYITESYSDTLFYQSLLSKTNNQTDYYFVNTQGKDKIPLVSNFYNAMGIENYSIYDFDFFRIKNFISQYLKYSKVLPNEKNMIAVKIDKIKEYINDLCLENEELNSYDKNSNSYKTKLQELKDYYYHEKGIRCLPEDLKNSMEDVLSILKSKGIIVLKNGCLETNLEDTKIMFTKNKNRWLEDALKYLAKTDEKELKTLNIYNYIYF